MMTENKTLRELTTLIVNNDDCAILKFYSNASGENPTGVILDTDMMATGFLTGKERYARLTKTGIPMLTVWSRHGDALMVSTWDLTKPINENRTPMEFKFVTTMHEYFKSIL